MVSAHKILLVDDEKDILEFLTYNLKKEGFEVYTSTDGVQALEMALKIRPHLVLLDVMMPEMDGVQTCEEMRKSPLLANTIIAFLTARGEDYSQIAGFEAGADDYITKPIKPKVLASRIRALLKRVTEQPVLEADNSNRSISVDREQFLVIKDGVEFVLPKKEFQLFSLLYSKPGKVFSREEIYATVWGNEVVVGDRTIDVHIRKLREKLGDEHIQTLKGIGYKYVD